MALLDAGARPGGEGRLGRGDRLLGVAGGGARIVADDVVGVRRVDVGRRLALDPFAGDVVAVQFVRSFAILEPSTVGIDLRRSSLPATDARPLCTLAGHKACTATFSFAPAASGLISGRPNSGASISNTSPGFGLDAGREGKRRRAEGVDMDVARPAEIGVLEVVRLEVGDRVRHVGFAGQERLLEDRPSCRGGCARCRARPPAGRRAGVPARTSTAGAWNGRGRDSSAAR